MAISAPKMMVPTILGFFRKRAIPGGQAALATSSRILLVKQSERLGNIVLMNAGISAISNAFPQARIDLILPASFAGVMAANSSVDRIIPIEKKKYITRPWLLIGMLRDLRARKYDLAIDCSDVNSHSSTGAAYTLLSGARFTAGWKMTERSIFDIEIPRYSELLHATEMYEKLFSGVFGQVIKGRPYFTQPLRQPTEAIPIVGINCGGRGSKRWPLANFVEVGRRLAAEGYSVEFILGPDEVGIRANLENSLSSGCRLLPLMSLPMLMEKMKMYKLFVSSDTGPMHLAWSLGIPTIAIFLDSELPKFRPLSPGSEALDGKDGISPEVVYEKSMTVLRAGRVPA